MSYTVTRQGNGHVFLLYRGRLRYRAEQTFERAEVVPGTVVTFTEHSLPPVVRRKVGPATPPATWVSLRCARCRKSHDVIEEACAKHGYPACAWCGGLLRNEQDSRRTA